MYSFHKAAPPEYYLDLPAGSGDEAMLGLGTAPTKGKPGYYDPLPSGDPLRVQPIWTGALSSSLGMADGSAVRIEELTALRYGVDPRDGKTMLVDGAPSVKEQIAAREAIAKAQTKLNAAIIALGKARSEALNMGARPSEANLIPKIAQAMEAVDKAKEDLKSAQADPGNRQDALDNVFSAPKGVSIYWARLKADGAKGDADAAAKAAKLEEAMVASVQAVIKNMIEPQLIFWRHRNGGHKDVSYENVKGIAAALVTHFTARPTTSIVDDPDAPGGKREVENKPDMQMHVHALCMALGLDQEDNARTIWTNMLGSQAKAIGAAFRADYAARLRGMGLDLARDAQKNIVSFDLAGVPDEAISAFSARSDQVEANRAEGMNHGEAKLAGRASKEDLDGGAILADWDVRMDALGLSAAAIESTRTKDLAREHALAEMEDLRDVGAIDFAPGTDAWERMLAGKAKTRLAEMEGRAPTVDEAVETLLGMESAFGLTEISHLAHEASQFCHDELRAGQTPMQWAEELTSKILRHPDLQRIHGADRYGRPTFTSRGLIAKEKALYYEDIPRLLAPRPDAIGAKAAEDAIALMEANETRRRGAPFKLRDFQVAMVRDMVASKSSIHIGLAPAGCGKTTLALAAVMAWEATGHTVCALAPSNKAAQGLAADLQKSRDEGMSPQKMLGMIKRGEFTLTSKHVLLIDEASMLDLDTSAAVVRAALSAEGGPARIELMGDNEQLPAVGRGNFFRSLAESSSFSSEGPEGERTITRVANSVADWNRINRQKDDLGKQATAFFAMGENAKALDIFERMGALNLRATRAECIASMAHAAYLPLAGAADDLSAQRERWLAELKEMGPEAQRALRKAKGAEALRQAISKMEGDDLAKATSWFAKRQALAETRDQLIKAHGSVAMIASKNADVDALNQKARDILKSIGALGGVDGKNVATIPRGRMGQMEICEDERLMFDEAVGSGAAEFSTKGDSAAKTTIGTVIGIARNAKNEVELLIQIDGKEGSTARINTAKFNKLSYAYAISAHRSQGISVERVFEFTSDFASTQTDYVTKSRHRASHSMYAVESDYGLFKKRALEAIEKADAKDMAFAADVFGLDAKQLAELDAGLAQARAAGAQAESMLRSARMRSIAQGTLVEHGAAPLGNREGAKMSHFATLSVAGKQVTLWGSGLAEALASTGAQVGDHIGLEASSVVVDGAAATRWVGYGKDALERAGVLMDSASISRLAEQAGAEKTQTATGPEGDPMAHAKSVFLTIDQTVSMAHRALTSAAIISAQAAQERGALDELGRLAHLPADLSARVARARSLLPYAKRGAGASIRELLAHGIEARGHTRYMHGSTREWLALDDELAYCATAWGTIEAWSIKDLPNKALNEARHVGGHIDGLEARRLDALAKAKAVAVDPVAGALAAYAQKLSIELVDHPAHGLCLGVSAAQAGSHRTDPDLRRLFAGEGDFGQDASSKKNGIGGLRECKGFDKGARAWIFKIRCDELGAPAGTQAAIDELVELGNRLGLSNAEASPWQAARAAAWEAIEARVAGPWGLAYALANADLGVHIPSRERLLSQTLSGRSEDIARWDDAILQGRDQAREWQRCSDKSADGSPLPDSQRRLEGIVVHADDRDVYVLRGQKILAIEREALGLSGPPESLMGRRVAILFSNDGPQLEAFEAIDVMEQGERLASRIAAGEAIDKLAGGLGAAAAYQRVSGADIADASHGYAMAWAQREARDMEALGARRASGMSSAATGARPLESYDGDALDMAGATIVEIGAQGVLIERAGARWLADKSAAREAMARDLREGATAKALMLERDGYGRARIDAQETHRARMALRAPTR